VVFGEFQSSARSRARHRGFFQLSSVLGDRAGVVFGLGRSTGPGERIGVPLDGILLPGTSRAHARRWAHLELLRRGETMPGGVVRKKYGPGPKLDPQFPSVTVSELALSTGTTGETICARPAT